MTAATHRELPECRDGFGQVAPFGDDPCIGLSMTLAGCSGTCAQVSPEG
jgi:hypothetical protein